MASKSGSRKKSGSTRSGDAGDKGLIAELKDRITVLENELRSKQECVTSSDVIERKQAEDFLKLASFSLNHARDIIFWFYPDGRVYYANDAACERLGYGRDELRSLSIFDINPNYVREDWDARWRRLREEGSLFYETENRAKDGSIFPIEATLNYIKYGDQELACGYARDITERKRAEEALRESERRYRGIVEDQTELIALLDIDGTITFVNDAYCRYFGKNREELVGHTFLTLVSEEDREAVKTSIAGLGQKNPAASIEQRVKLPDGSLAWQEWKNRIVFDEHGRPIGYQSVGRDITESKRAEEALQESEEKFRVLAETSPAAIFLYQGEKYVYVNPMAEVLTGYSRYELLTMDAWEWIHPEFIELVKERARKRQRGEKLPNRYEVKYRARDGREGWVDFVAGLIEYRGKPAGLAMAFDVTKRKQAEEALKETKAQAELYVDLMGHDINNMNQVSMGFLELAHNIIEMEGKLGEDNIVLLDKAMNSLKDSSQLIDSVRKLQREKMGLYKTEVLDIDSVIEEAAKQFHSIPGREVKIVFTPRTHCRVRANSLLKDVFINLVGNAVKHSKGALTVSIQVDRVADNGIRYCRVAVEDDGPGIPDGLKATLFDRLNLTTTRARGKGFGLCLIKMLVDDYHGKFWVEDRVKGDHTKGARFVVTLPAVEK